VVKYKIGNDCAILLTYQTKKLFCLNQAKLFAKKITGKRCFHEQAMLLLYSLNPCLRGKTDHENYVGIRIAAPV